MSRYRILAISGDAAAGIEDGNHRAKLGNGLGQREWRASPVHYQSSAYPPGRNSVSGHYARLSFRA